MGFPRYRRGNLPEWLVGPVIRVFQPAILRQTAPTGGAQHKGEEGNAGSRGGVKALHSPTHT